MSDNDRETVRQYLLGTLSERDAEEVRSRAERDGDWAAAIEAERARLAWLDALPVEEPPDGLADRTMGRIAEAEQRPSRFRMYTGALATAAAVVLVVVAAVVVSRARGHFAAEQARNDLRQIGLALKLYSAESRGELYPPVAPYDGIWMFDVSRLYPKYVDDITVFAAPNRPGYRERAERLKKLVADEPVDWEAVTRIAAEHMSYTGWSTTEPDAVRRLAEVRPQLAREAYEDDLEFDGERLVRLRDGVERFFITDINNAGASGQAQADVPLLFQHDNDTNPDDDFVLFLDGHVDDAAAMKEMVAAWYRALMGALR